MRAGLTILAFGALLTISAPAWADASADAVSAFNEGRKLRDEGNLKAAIAAFERSIKLEPSIGANYNLGYCFEQVGRRNEALAAYRQAATIARQRNDPRLADAEDAVKKLLDSHDHVVLKTPLAVAETSGLRVELDGQPVPQPRLNGEVFSAGKVHTVAVAAPGHKDVRARLQSGETFTVVLGGASVSEPESPPPSAVGPAGPWGWQKWTGLGLAGAGVVTAGVGIVLALGYSSEQDQLQRDTQAFCATRKCVAGTPDVAPYEQRAKDIDSNAVTRNVIVFGIAGALMAGGAILFFTAPQSSAKETARAETVRVRVLPQVGQRDTGLSVVGTF